MPTAAVRLRREGLITVIVVTVEELVTNLSVVRRVFLYVHDITLLSPMCTREGETVAVNKPH